jgi:hypothetical protein
MQTIYWPLEWASATQERFYSMEITNSFFIICISQGILEKMSYYFMWSTVGVLIWTNIKLSQQLLTLTSQSNCIWNKVIWSWHNRVDGLVFHIFGQAAVSANQPAHITILTQYRPNKSFRLRGLSEIFFSIYYSLLYCDMYAWGVDVTW